jgi:hypothetical protein
VICAMAAGASRAYRPRDAKNLRIINGLPFLGFAAFC